MQVQGVTPILNVSDVAGSQAWFGKLGWKTGFRWPYDDSTPPSFGSVSTDKAEIFLCLGAQGSRATMAPLFPGDDHTDGVWMTWWLESPDAVDAMYALALKEGMTATYPPTDEPWNVREFHLRHPYGHMFRVSGWLNPG